MCPTIITWIDFDYIRHSTAHRMVFLTVLLTVQIPIVFCDDLRLPQKYNFLVLEMVYSTYKYICSIYNL
jgi:hypothetical protein